MTVLLTGGTGYIGSHTAVELIGAGHDVVLADNLSNSAADVPDRIGTITGRRPPFHKIDIADREALRDVFRTHTIDAVIHFAGLKAVGESVQKPVHYYRNNLDTTLTLLEVMKEFGCKKLVFSSSATVYGTGRPPFTEDMPTGNCTNPYGWTKWMIEQILQDAAHADKELSVAVLRYFNPVGAHKSGLIGEMPSGTPNNVMPLILQAASGRREKFFVFGNDYPTLDGTGIRDYIHVVDLAKGHLAALLYLTGRQGIEAFNLGTGNGFSVLELLRTFMETNRVSVPYEIAPRRPGDVDASYADAGKAKNLLHWQAENTLSDMCRDAWTWERNYLAQAPADTGSSQGEPK